MIETSWKRQFITLWAGQSVSVLTSAVIQMSLVWYITSETGSAAVMSAGTLMGFIPRAVIGPFAGVFIDRFSRRRVMILSDLFISAGSLTVVFYGFFAEIPIWLVMFALFCRSLGGAFHLPALQALTPAIVPRENLTGYAGFAHGFESMSHIISPALAAILFEKLSLNLLMLLDVFGALFAVLTLCFIRIPRESQQRHSRHGGYFSEFKEGFAIVRMQPPIVFILVISCLYSIIYAPIGSYYPLITMTYFCGGIRESALVETILSLGTLAGAFALGLFGSKIHKMRAFALSIMTYGICVTVTGAIPPEMFHVFVVSSAITGLSIPFYSGVRTSIIQMRFAPAYLGRIFALTMSLTTFTTPIGLILAGIFAEKIGIAQWFMFSGIAAVLLGLATLTNPLMKKDHRTDKGSNALCPDDENL